MNFSFASFIIFVGLLLTALSTFDKIVKFQHKHYKENWEKDGQIEGFFSFNVSFSNATNRGGKFLSWTFINADWMKNDFKVLRLVWLMRICIFSFWLLGFVSFVINRPALIR
jgi:hypothetical protein